MAYLIKTIRFLGILFCICLATKATAQIDTTKILVDDIQIDLKKIEFDKKENKATVYLYLISYQKNPRELRLNTFACMAFDQKQHPYLYSTMHLGNVMVLAEKRQNYLYYLMEQNKPVKFTIEYENWPEEKTPDHVKIVFEDSGEKGKFLEVYVPLSQAIAI